MWTHIVFITCMVCYTSGLNRDAVRQALLERRSVHLDPFFREQALIRSKRQASDFLSDDEDLSSLDGSGDDSLSRLKVASTPTPTLEYNVASSTDWGWYRTKINFLDSIEYSPALADYHTDEFLEVSDQIMVAIEEHLNNYMGGYHEATPLMIFMKGGDVYAMVDVGMCMGQSIDEVTDALQSLVRDGMIGSFRVSDSGFSIRQIGVDSGRVECAPGPVLESTTPAPAFETTLIYTTTTTTERTPPLPTFDLSTTTPPQAPQTTTYYPERSTTYFPETNPPFIPQTAPPFVIETVPPPFVPQTTPPKPLVTNPPGPRLCRADQATCRNGQCIDRSYICDGTADCLDGSDEPPTCAVTNNCDPTEFLCVGTGVCAQKTWRCDGDNDCGNNYDETNCPTASPDAACPSMHFQCNSGACIPSSYQCDNERDCDDGSDENNCRPPVVVSPPERFVNATQGDTVELFCEAVGVPTPIISWRVNWGNVPPPPRVTMTTVGGKGVLTIRKVKKSDQGAYTCEGINSQGAIFGRPDAILQVTEGGIENGGSEIGCPEGQFSPTGSLDDCTACYCFGVTDQCSASKLEFTEIGIEFTQPDDDQGVTLEPKEKSTNGGPPPDLPVTSNQIFTNPAAKELQLIDLSKRFLAAAHYWSLPAQFVGAKINSYGGTLEFSFSYNNSYNFTPRPTNASDVILEGNGKTLVYHHDGPAPKPGVKNQANVLLTEDKWKNEDGSDVSREDMLGVLANVDRILLRTVYDNSMLSTGIGDVKLQVARAPSPKLPGEEQPAGSLASMVEECECPPGYTGLSCELCDEGYIRMRAGPVLGRCVRETPAIPICDTGYTGPECTECEEGYTPFEGGCTRYPGTYCDVAGSIGVGVGRQCKCKAGCEGPRCNKCKPGFYYLSQDNPDGCKPCFCMGVADTCESSTWNRTQVSPSFRSGDYFILTNRLQASRFHDHITYVKSLDGTRQPVVTAHLNLLPLDVYYWMLPEEFVGNKITSYGGRLDFTINYSEIEGARPITRIAIAKITGNGITLVHMSDTHPPPDRDTRFVIEMVESKWQKADTSEATREELMMVLSNVESFLVRATFSNRVQTTSISNIYLEVASPQHTGRGRAYKVEQCSCPPGYTGLSCEECSNGYHRIDGEYLGTCVKCDCNGHSNTCDKTTGVCNHCRHNTAGDHCEQCDYGYYGDARGGAEGCQRCPCPLIRNDIVTCHVTRGGEPVCDRCPPGYSGNICNLCAPGYEEVSNSPVLVCQLSDDSSCRCDPSGSTGDTCDENGQCNCKASATGKRCDECKPGYYYLSVDNEEGGCLPCFCMGVTRECTSASYQRNTITTDFSENFGSFSLTDRLQRSSVTDGFEVTNRGGSISHPRLDTLQRGTSYYWVLPEEYKGDKIVSYGGKLQYTVTYTTYAQGVQLHDSDVIITGNDITLLSTGSDSAVVPNRPTEKVIVFREANWKRADGQPATREHLLMVLADVETILIRATFSSSMLRTSLSSISMETASESVLMTEPAMEVEQCVCPAGYEGLSCEDCAPGFTRSGGGIYLGLCHSCQCNGHSDQCDSETGVCQSCRDNTSGDRCEQCNVGYFGDATQGTPADCRLCACPGYGDNSFSDTCEYNTDSRNLVCTNCREGHVGDRCERCAPGYTGNPQDEGGECVRRAEPVVGSHPVVKVSPKRVNARRGASVTVQCEVNSPYPTIVEWYKGTSSSRLSLPPTATISNNGHTLTFARFGRNEAGTYVCIAHNNYGVGSDTTVLLIARERPMIKVRVEEPRRITTRPGSQATFVCTATSKMPAYIVSWTKRGGMLPLSRATDYNGILHIRDLRPSDAGTYVCTGSNMYTTDSETATLEVIGASTPTVIVTPNNQSVAEGQEAIFYCNARGFPTPDIEWHRVDGHPMPSNVKMEGRMLMIPSASQGDRSLYECRASNQHGTAEAAGALDVFEPFEAPRVVVTQSEVIIEYGDNATLECQVEGTPPPNIEWGIFGYELADNTHADQGRLSITSAKLENQGTYTCTASNTFGRDEGYVYVTVQRTFPNTDKPICRTDPKEVTAYVGTNSTITCTVGGNPLPTISWEGRDGAPLHHNMRVVGSDLFIENVELSNTGSFVCVATSYKGVSRSQMTLHVVKKDLPKVSIQPSHYQKVNAGTDVTFTCSTNETDADITWLRADQKHFTGNTYLSENSRVLHLDGVTPEETGTYKCIASNAAGHREVAAYIHVIAPPAVRVSPAKFIDLRVGESVKLMCSSRGTPLPSVIWRKHNMTGNGMSKQLTNYRRGSGSYMLSNVRLDQAGDYICEAINEAGRSTVTVVVMVHPRLMMSEPDVIIASSTYKGIVGNQAELRCVATGKPSPTIKWSKRNGELPEGSYQTEGTLIIPSLSASHVGEFTCTATNVLGSDSKTVTVSIIEPPTLSIQPSPSMKLVEGTSYSISCSSSDVLPVSYSWMKESGEMSSTVLTSGGRMQITSFNPNTDVGRYTCKGLNDAGVATVTLTITAAKPPVATISPQEVTKEVGSSVKFVCSVQNNENNAIVWKKVDGSELDFDRVITDDNTMMIHDITITDGGEYECSVSNDIGSSSATATLTVHSLPTVTISSNKLIYNEGDVANITCTSTGVPMPTVTIFKDGEEIITATPGHMFIPSLTSDVSGVYACLASSVAGSSEDSITITVHTVPVATVENKIVTVTSGDRLSVACSAAGNPTPTISWAKNGSLVSSSDELIIDNVKVDDSGVYVCNATSVAGSNFTSVDVVVNAFLPFFSQTPLSYLTLNIPDGEFYTKFDIKISFKPNVLSGVIFYGYGGGGDFMSLAIIDGQVSFMFDVGSGPINIVGTTPITKGEWHTVWVSRQERKGQLKVNDQDTVMGKSPGEFRALDLGSELYIGGVPTAVGGSLPEGLRMLGSDSGFYGCMSQVEVGSASIDLGSSSRITEMIGVVRCRTCGDDGSLCLHESVCTESHLSSQGFMCSCMEGNVGQHCQFVEKDLCNEGSCGSHGKCEVDLNLEIGYLCTCNTGYSGVNCEVQPILSINTLFRDNTHTPDLLEVRGVGELPANLVAGEVISVGRGEVPVGEHPGVKPIITTTETMIDVGAAVAFNRDSYIMTSSMNASQPRRTDVVMRIRRRSDADGLLLYNGGQSSTTFVSLSIRSGAVEFRYGSGDDVAVLRSPMSQLQVGSWHTIRAVRRRSRGRLDVDGRTVARGRTSSSPDLYLDAPMFVGGSRYWDRIPPRVDVRDGFDGCIDELRIDDIEIPFNEMFVRKNTRSCEVQPQPSVQDEAAVFPGVSPPRHLARFSGDSFASFAPTTFPHDGSAEQISFDIRATSPDGLVLFHGEDLTSEPSETSRLHKRSHRGRSKDYISVGIQESKLVYSFDLGGGQGRAVSDFPVVDGLWHHVTIVRRGSLALMWLDDVPTPVAAQAPGSHTMANTPGRVYVGGAPDVIFATAGRYTTGFMGCIGNLRFTGIPPTRASELGSRYLDDDSSPTIDFSHSVAIERVNIRRCNQHRGVN
nr:basement membrane-specific heparan sulfate proteoglycan core protein [Ciona intestinalis]|eukprot:XP_018666843.1 basement membrane-specific heparan sulfate proteoglycan core protein [Ciona intestinalis]